MAFYAGFEEELRMGVKLWGLEPELVAAVQARLPGAQVIEDECSIEPADVVVHDPRRSDPTRWDTMQACREVWRILVDRAPARYVQLSTMHLLDRHDPGWMITERFAPLPGDDPGLLTAHLAELTSREITRARPIQACVLRLGDLVDHEPGWDELHLDDAADAIATATSVTLVDEAAQAAALARGDDHGPLGTRWRVLHITNGTGRYPVATAGDEPFRYAPQHPCSERRPRPRPTMIDTHWPQPVSRALPEDDVVVLYGAGGALGGPASEALAQRSRVVQCDALDPAEWSTVRQEGSGVPTAIRLPAPHEQCVCDVRDPEQVLAASEGATSIVSMGVVRHDPVLAWEVNLAGLLHIIDAARARGIRRLVTCGPALSLRQHPIGYHEDRWVPDDAPPRPGDHLYSLTQFLAQEALRVLAEEWDISACIVLFTGFSVPDDPDASEFLRRSEFQVNWHDGARAVAAAVAVQELPSSAPTVEVRARGPHGWRPQCGAERLLGWRAEADMSPMWWHPDASGGDTVSS